MGRFDEWVRGGQISFEQAETMDGATGSIEPGGPRTAEVLGYFGAVAFSIAVLILAWDLALEDGVFGLFLGEINNLPAGGVAVVGAAVLLFLGMRAVASDAGAIRRSGGFLFLLTFGLVNTATTFLLWDLDAADFTPVIQATPGVVVAWFVWTRWRSTPTQLALFLAVDGAVASLLVLFQLEDGFEPTQAITSAVVGASPELFGWVSWLAGLAIGVTWLWLGWTRRLRPRNTAFVLGGLYAWVSALALFFSADGWLIVSIGLAALFVYTALTWRSSVLGAFAMITTAVVILQVIAVSVDEPSVVVFVLAYGIPGVLALFGLYALSGDRTASASPVVPVEGIEDAEDGPATE